MREQLWIKGMALGKMAQSKVWLFSMTMYDFYIKMVLSKIRIFTLFLCYYWWN